MANSAIVSGSSAFNDHAHHVALPESPIVFVDGLPRSGMRLRSFESNGTLDERSAVIAMDADLEPTARSTGIFGHAVIATPMHFNDGQRRQPALMQGVLRWVSSSDTTNESEVLMTMADGWSILLDERPSVGWSSFDDSLRADSHDTGELGVGIRANRSIATYSIQGEMIHVPQADPRTSISAVDEPWTIGTALATLSAIGNLKLKRHKVPKAIADIELTTPVSLNGSLRSALLKVLDQGGLRIARTMAIEAGRIVESRSVLPSNRGRRVAISRQDHVLGRHQRTGSPVAQHWHAVAAGWLVETTQVMAPGWDSQLEGEPDATYSRADDAFPQHANVYRLWVLNEDGAYSNPPINAGPAFDLSAVFDESIQPQAIPWQPCLVTNASGDRLEPIVEMSLDAGQTWSIYPSVAKILNDRAGVYLEDDTLSAGFLAAAKTGDARIRVTGSLRSPASVSIDRWSGNPFQGVNNRDVLDVSHGFRFQRVDPTSNHFQDVANQSKTAEQHDDRRRMTNWLYQQIDREADRPVTDGSTTQRVSLIGDWSMTMLGDRLKLIEKVGDGVPVAEELGPVTSIRTTWHKNKGCQTEMELH